VHVQQLERFDGGDNHSVYVDVINTSGQHIASPNVKVEFGYGSEVKTTIFEKPEWEPGANFVLGAGANAWCRIAGFPSDTVQDLYSGYGHTSYYVVFQLQTIGDITQPEPPPVVQPPGTTNVSVDVILEIEKRLAELTTAIHNLR
jgi:hypothetical protein